MQQFGYKESANEKKMKAQPDSQNRVFKLLSKKVDFIKFPIWFNFSVTWCFFWGGELVWFGRNLAEVVLILGGNIKWSGFNRGGLRLKLEVKAWNSYEFRAFFLTIAPFFHAFMI